MGKTLRCCAISVDVTKLDSQAELKSIDEQADNEIVQRSGGRKTDSSSHQSFDVRAQRQVFVFQLLGLPLADSLLAWLQMSAIRAPAVGVKPTNPERC